MQIGEIVRVNPLLWDLKVSPSSRSRERTQRTRPHISQARTGGVRGSDLTVEVVRELVKQHGHVVSTLAPNPKVSAVDGTAAASSEVV